MQAREHAIILGSSGSGKTTLLHLIGALMPARAGSILLNGYSYGKNNLDRWRGENVGIVFQKPHLVGALTVTENLNLAFTLNNKKMDGQRRDGIVEKLGLNKWKQKKPYQLSQGQAQRVSIARALMNDPKLILADEPTASLDDKNAEEVIELLQSQAHENEAILIIATHDQRVKDRFKNQYVL